MKDEKVLELLEFSLSNLDIKDILTKVVEKIRKEIGAERSTLFLYDEDDNMLESIVFEADKLKKIKIPVNLESIAGYVAIKQKPVNLKNIYDEEEMKSIDKDLKYHKGWVKVSNYITQSMISLPIIASGKFLGVFVATNKVPYFSEEDQKLLEKFIPILANLLNHLLLLEEIKRQNILRKNIIDKIKEGIIILNKKDEIEDVNPTFLEITGHRWTAEEITGKNIKDGLDELIGPSFYEKLSLVKEFLVEEEYMNGIVKIRIIPIIFEMLGENKLKNIVLMVDY